MPKIVNKLLWLILGGGVLVFLDQLIKFAVRAREVGLTPFSYLDPIQYQQSQIWWLTWHKNYGISFGIELPYYLSVGLMVAFLLFLLWVFFQRSTSHPLMVTGLILSIAGGVGNLIDRVNLGYVRDYIALSPWLPIFNFADILVVSGVVLMLWGIYRYGRS